MEFIRLDVKGTWKGTEHRSCFAGTSLTESDEDIVWENGISCYRLDDKVVAIDNLYKYWVDIARLERVSDYENMQVTIFEGNLVGQGSDYEDLAICSKTVKEFNAVEFMAKLFDAKEKLENYQNEWEEDEELLLTEEQYKLVLEKLI